MSNDRRSTALVTGASSGIGRELARLFAADHHDVVLVARSAERLEALAHELVGVHGIRARAMAVDLAEPGAPAALVERLAESGVAIDFLVNNAGFGSNGPFFELDAMRELQMIDLNVRALVDLTHRLGGPMRARGHGRILNIASTAGFQAGPFMATYYATKAFVLSFSEALAYELAGSGVTVTCHCPGATATEFATTAGNDQTRLFRRSGVADARDVASHAYRAMLRGEVLSIHGALNWLGTQTLRVAPRALLRRVVASLNRSPP